MNLEHLLRAHSMKNFTRGPQRWRREARKRMRKCFPGFGGTDGLRQEQKQRKILGRLTKEFLCSLQAGGHVWTRQRADRYSGSGREIGITEVTQRVRSKSRRAPAAPVAHATTAMNLEHLLRAHSMKNFTRGPQRWRREARKRMRKCFPGFGGTDGLRQEQKQRKILGRLTKEFLCSLQAGGHVWTRQRADRYSGSGREIGITEVTQRVRSKSRRAPAAPVAHATTAMNLEHLLRAHSMKNFTRGPQRWRREARKRMRKCFPGFGGTDGLRQEQKQRKILRRLTKEFLCSLQAGGHVWTRQRADRYSGSGREIGITEVTQRVRSKSRRAPAAPVAHATTAMNLEHLLRAHSMKNFTRGPQRWRREARKRMRKCFPGFGGTDGLRQEQKQRKILRRLTKEFLCSLQAGGHVWTRQRADRYSGSGREIGITEVTQRVRSKSRRAPAAPVAHATTAMNLEHLLRAHSMKNFTRGPQRWRREARKRMRKCFPGFGGTDGLRQEQKQRKILRRLTKEFLCSLQAGGHVWTRQRADRYSGSGREIGITEVTQRVRSKSRRAPAAPVAHATTAMNLEHLLRAHSMKNFTRGPQRWRREARKRMRKCFPGFGGTDGLRQEQKQRKILRRLTKEFLCSLQAGGHVWTRQRADRYSGSGREIGITEVTQRVRSKSRRAPAAPVAHATTAMNLEHLLRAHSMKNFTRGPQRWRREARKRMRKCFPGFGGTDGLRQEQKQRKILRRLTKEFLCSLQAGGHVWTRQRADRYSGSGREIGITEVTQRVRSKSRRAPAAPVAHATTAMNLEHLLRAHSMKNFTRGPQRWRREARKRMRKCFPGFGGTDGLRQEQKQRKILRRLTKEFLCSLQAGGHVWTRQRADRYSGSGREIGITEVTQRVRSKSRRAPGVSAVYSKDGAP
ncbi:uncharacterized protein LOC130684987 isoform X2 [Manis pentadactyla]|nr:uncharacterized protein LOC130684987 isoform X2 [Manis pentadactyla]XP_057364121.1 uncharacterized protein LOC130684987 isoform X2 [Manis pentadactyla]